MADIVIVFVPGERYGNAVVAAPIRSILRVDPTLTVRSSESMVTVVDAGRVTTLVQDVVLIVAVRAVVAELINTIVGYDL